MSFTAAFLQHIRSLPGLRVWSRAPLAPFTSVGVGGRAELMVTVLMPESLPPLLAALADEQLPWAVLGAGSNVLVADSGFSGVVLKLEGDLSYVEVHRGDRNTLVAGAALGLPRLAACAADWGLSGLEFAGGIPGTVGGAVCMNAGAYGTSLGEVVDAVELAGPAGMAWLSAADLDWDYRGCRLPPGTVVTAAAVRLASDESSSVLTRHRGLLRSRRQSQPRGVRTFGSVFKNPPGHSAGRLLDGAGMKGARRGGAEVSQVHANFIVNAGDALASDVLTLMAMMREGVYVRHGVILEPEVHLLGARFPW
jgi:UDP-N-acetylenolpyruvoylglucosamine reductase